MGRAAVLGHLTGWPLPVPDAPLITTLQALHRRLRDCAVGHAVDAAVAVRSTTISHNVSPGALAEHVATAMRALLDGRWPCERDEPWRAAETTTPARRRALLLGAASPSALEVAVGCHAASTDWRAALGAAMTNFRGCRWPLAELTPVPIERNQDGGRRQ